MENKSQKLQSLIDEFRKRVSQLKSYTDEDYLMGVFGVADWLFKIRDFEPVFDYLEELSLWEIKIIDEVGQKLFNEIEATWKALKNYITSDFLSKLDEVHFIEIKQEKKIDRFLRLQQMVEGDEKFHILDIYHELRQLIKQAYYMYGNKLNELVTLSKDHAKEIKEFVPPLVFDAFLSFQEIDDRVKKQRSYSPLETFGYLKQLLVLHDNDDWQWQFKKCHWPN